MGFLDRAVKAATAAKTQIDEVRDARAAASVTPAPARELDEHEREVLARARAAGAPDPFVLVGPEEASTVVGIPLGGPSLVYGDDFTGLSFAASGSGGRHWRADVSAFHGTADAPHFEAGPHWVSFLRELVADDGTPVPGLGQEAFLRDSDLFVLADPLLLMVSVSTPDDDAVDRERMVELARLVLARVGLDGSD